MLLCGPLTLTLGLPQLPSTSDYKLMATWSSTTRMPTVSGALTLYVLSPPTPHLFPPSLPLTSPLLFSSLLFSSFLPGKGRKLSLSFGDAERWQPRPYLWHLMGSHMGLQHCYLLINYYYDYYLSITRMLIGKGKRGDERGGGEEGGEISVVRCAC